MPLAVRLLNRDNRRVFRCNVGTVLNGSARTAQLAMLGDNLAAFGQIPGCRKADDPATSHSARRAP
jgi:hypothetical protein